MFKTRSKISHVIICSHLKRSLKVKPENKTFMNRSALRFIRTYTPCRPPLLLVLAVNTTGIFLLQNSSEVCRAF